MIIGEEIIVTIEGEIEATIGVETEVIMPGSVGIKDIKVEEEEATTIMIIEILNHMAEEEAEAVEVSKGKMIINQMTIRDNMGVEAEILPR